MTYEMNLHPGPFELIKSGQKDIEMRLYDDRRKAIRIGDIIKFINRDTNETLIVEVINLYHFNSFDELYRNFDKTRLGYKTDEEANPSDMELYYFKEQIQKFGVLGIEIQLK